MRIKIPSFVSLLCALAGCSSSVPPAGDAGALEPDAPRLEPDAAVCAPDSREPDDEPRDIFPFAEGDGAGFTGATVAGTFHAGDAGDWVWFDFAEGTGVPDGRVRITAEDAGAEEIEVRVACGELAAADCPGTLDEGGWCVVRDTGAVVLDVVCPGSIEVRVGALPGEGSPCEHSLVIGYGSQD